MVEKAINYVLLSCCSYKRPRLLSLCLNSINKIILPDDIKVEILIIDNDAEKSAQNVVEDFQKKTEFKCHYFVEEKRGLASARNRLLDEAINLGASHIMLFDDDEVLTSNALIEHIKLCQKYDEQIISSGVQINKFLENTPNFVKKSIAFKQKSSKKTGQIKMTCASNNAFFPVEMLTKNNLRFSEKYVFIGGEDGEFFHRASQNGYKIIQNSESVLYEIVPKKRANIKYIFKKSYYNGFASAYSRFKNSKKKYLYVTKQMIILCVNLLMIIPSVIFGLTGFVNCISMAIRAFGKIMGAISKKPINFYKKVYGE